MIQRIQTIFLLTTAILMAVALFTPLADLVAVGTDINYVFYSCGLGSTVVVSYPTWGVLVLAALAALLPFSSIFFYKNRKLQLKVGMITSLMIVGVYLTAYVYIYSISTNQDLVFQTVRYGAILPLIAFVFNILAMLGIKKDEKLIQSLNRIR
ncbi:MAG: hypothetical protein RL662_848 [Bacteroidota bacterium]|jgi:hypothetical protein